FYCNCLIRCYFLLSFHFIITTVTTSTTLLSLHDALPISAQMQKSGWPRRVWIELHSQGGRRSPPRRRGKGDCGGTGPCRSTIRTDRKSTRLNSSHVKISYAVFCLKKKTNQ